jgi:hypothetical protein
MMDWSLWQFLAYLSERWGGLGWIGVDWADCDAFGASTCLEGENEQKRPFKARQKTQFSALARNPCRSFIVSVSVETRLSSSLTPSQIFTKFQGLPHTEHDEGSNY